MNHVALELGQPVRRPGEHPDAVGCVVGLVFSQPTLAVVRWGHAPASFEPLESLVTTVHLLQ